MMHEAAMNLIRRLQDERQEAAFAGRLLDWLMQEALQAEEEAPTFTASRARALLRAGDLLDATMLNDFFQLMSRRPACRVALYELVADTSLVENPSVAALPLIPLADDEVEIDWLSLIVAAYCWKSNYPLYQLDPAIPPETYSPAGQAIRRSASFIRKQVLLSATERDKVARMLSGPPTNVPTMDELQADGQPVAPLPPHYRHPIPESYPEMASETVQIEMDDLDQQPAITVGEPVVITEEELSGGAASEGSPTRMPPITIEREQIHRQRSTPPSPLPNSAVVMPASSSVSRSRPSLTVSLKNVFNQEELKSTKLYVIVQDYPDGPGIYGLQVKVTCKGIKSYVAGTTDREGRFICELPVRMQSGLTYDVAVTWPRSEGGGIESKSITLNADRTRFSLPFYRALDPPAGNP